MGNFLAVTAFHTDSVVSVRDAVTQYLTSYDVTTELTDLTAAPDSKLNMEIYNPINGWTIVLWPEYFNVHDFPLVRTIAAGQNWLISTIHVYDDEYWEHLCCSGANELHSFASRPNFWKEESPPDFERILSYSSEPSRFAAAIGIQPQLIHPYLVDVDALSNANTKAHVSDEFALDDIWVFTNFWRRCGIEYPDPPRNLAMVIRLRCNFQSKLPTS